MFPVDSSARIGRVAEQPMRWSYMADFISNSAISTPIRPALCLQSSIQLGRRGRKMAEFAVNSDIAIIDIWTLLTTHL